MIHMYVYIWRQGFENNSMIVIWTSCAREISVKLCLGLLEGIYKQPKGLQRPSIFTSDFSFVSSEFSTETLHNLRVCCLCLKRRLTSTNVSLFDNFIYHLLSSNTKKARKYSYLKAWIRSFIFLLKKYQNH